jgi:hypothetical protein
MGHVLATLEDTTRYPAQEMIDLYLYALHWLLMFNKALVVSPHTLRTSY